MGIENPYSNSNIHNNKELYNTIQKISIRLDMLFSNVRNVLHEQFELYLESVDNVLKDKNNE